MKLWKLLSSVGLSVIAIAASSPLASADEAAGYIEFFNVAQQTSDLPSQSVVNAANLSLAVVETSSFRALGQSAGTNFWVARSRNKQHICLVASREAENFTIINCVQKSSFASEGIRVTFGDSLADKSVALLLPDNAAGSQRSLTVVSSFTRVSRNLWLDTSARGKAQHQGVANNARRSSVYLQSPRYVEDPFFNGKTKANVVENSPFRKAINGAGTEATLTKGVYAYIAAAGGHYAMAQAEVVIFFPAQTASATCKWNDIYNQSGIGKTNGKLKCVTYHY